MCYLHFTSSRFKSSSNKYFVLNSLSACSTSKLSSYPYTNSYTNSYTNTYTYTYSNTYSNTRTYNLLWMLL